MSLLLKIRNIIYSIFLSYTPLGTQKTNKIMPDEYGILIHEYVKKHPEIMIERSKDL